METEIGKLDMNEELEDKVIDMPSTNNKLVYLLLALIIGLSASVYWLWMQQQTVNSQMQSEVSDLMSNASGSRSVEQDMASLEASLEASLTEKLSQLAEQQIIVNESIESLSSNMKLSGADVEYYWVMAELNYLLNVANQRVLLAKDSQGASDALALADQRIEALSDYRLHPLRALLAEEQLALAAVNKVDIEGMVIQLNSAVAAVEQLHVLLAAPTMSDESKSSDEQDGWQSAAGHAWQQVKSLVVIRHQQDGAAAVLIPEQRYFLYQNLQLKLELAQLALLRGEQTLFHSSLTEASEWLKRYFVGDDSDAMQAVFEELMTENIEAHYPDISASLTWLRGFEQ